jgi:hypothetical protein
VLRVEVQEGAKDSQGSLVVVGADGAASSVRRVRATTCDDVVRALALVAALAIDPEAKTAPRVAPSPLPQAPDAEPPPSATAPATAVDAGAPEAATSPPPRTTARTTPTAPPKLPEPPEPPPRGRRSPSVSAWGLEGATVLEARPSPVLVVGLDVARNRLLAPWLARRLPRAAYPPEMQQYTRGLAEVGARSTASATRPRASLPPRSKLKHLLTDYLQVPRHLGRGRRHRARHQWLRGREVDRVLANWEVMVLTAARLRERFGMPGMSVDTVRASATSS